MTPPPRDDRPGTREPTLLIMARAPVPGSTKTRLHPLLGPNGCARLQAALIRRAAALGGGMPGGGAAGGGTVLAYTPPEAGELLRPLVGNAVTLVGQRGSDLGQRMAAAVCDVAATRPGPVIVIGTDCPVLSPAHLAAAAGRLREGDDVVLGPAVDGGYYLIALAHPDPRVFALPTHAWGGPDVATLTVRAAAAAGLNTGFIQPEHDLDTPADVTGLLADPRLPPEIAAILLDRKVEEANGPRAGSHPGSGMHAMTGVRIRTQRLRG